MPVPSAEDFLATLDIFRDALDIAKAVRDTSPIRKNNKGEDMCHYCDEKVVGTDELTGKPIIVHAADCTYKKAQNLKARP